MYKTEGFKQLQTVGQGVVIPEYTAYSVKGKGFLSRMWANYNTSFNGFELRVKIIVDGVQINDSGVTFYESMRLLTTEVLSVTSYDNLYMLRIPFNSSLEIKLFTIAHSNTGTLTVGCNGLIMVEGWKLGRCQFVTHNKLRK